MIKVTLTPRAEKEFAKLSYSLQSKLYQEFKKLESNLFGLKVKKIKGTVNGYRLRVGRYRILFVLFSTDKLIEIVDIFLKKGEKDYKRRKGLF